MCSSVSLSSNNAELNLERQSPVLDWLVGKPGWSPQDWAGACLVALTVVFFFAKTVFLGMPISKIALLPEWDSLYSAYWTGVGSNCDPSLVQLMVPYYFTAAKFWQSGLLPLWNPYSGFGVPFVGDPQAAIFSPLHVVLYLMPVMRVYNLTIVFTVILSALGTFALCRSFELARFASVLAALCYALCPFNLYNLELNTGTADCLYPGLFWLFVRTAQRPSLARAALAGVGCAVIILSGHPESVFFGITFASLLMAVLIMLDRTNLSDLARGLLTVAGSLACAGAVAFCLSAPVLVPFVEYLLNCDSYKMSIGGSTWIPWQCITYNLLQPGFGPASPFLGVATAIGLLLAITMQLRGRRDIVALLCTTATAIIVTARLGPLDAWLTVKPFNCLITVYCMPVVLLLFSVLSAAGLSLLTGERKDRTGGRFFTVLGAAAVIAAVPSLLHILHVPLRSGDWDLMLPHMAVDLRSFTQQLIMLSILLGIFLISRHWIRCPQWLLPIAVMVVGFISLATVAKGALPIQHRFDYPVVEPIPLLQKSDERMVALGDHLFRPNTSAVYGISDIRTHNPLFPARYLEFLKQAGAKIDMFNQIFESAESPLLDLASVRYVLSLNPLAETAGKRRLINVTAQGIHVYENLNYLPRAYMVPQCIKASGSEEALRLISTAGFNPRITAVIEGDISAAMLNSSTVAAGAVTRMARSASGNITVETNSTAPGSLVITDVFYPGWKAELDGREIPILRANYLFRAVEVPAGRHKVTLEYSPRSFWTGACLAAGCLIALTFIALRSRRRV